MATEADTCRQFVVPKLQAAGWDSDPHSIAEQRSFTDGRIVVRGSKGERKKKKRADYLLNYTRDFPLAVTEAKAEYKKAADGMQQAKEYREILDLKFCYATNGREIIEFDAITGIERPVATFPTPAQLWARLMAAEKLAKDTVERVLTPFNLSNGKIPHYYQRIAIDRVRYEYGKLWFNILDYTGTATRNFADPGFDGNPAFATEDGIDHNGEKDRINKINRIYRILTLDSGAAVSGVPLASCPSC